MLSGQVIGIGVLTFVISFFGISVLVNHDSKLFEKQSLVKVLGSDTEILSPLADSDYQKLPHPSPAVEPTPSSTPMPMPTSTPVPIATAKPSPTATPSAPPATGIDLDRWFSEYANKESVSPDLLRKIAVCESKLNPTATNGLYGGLFQFSVSTWVSTRHAMNQNPDPKLRLNAQEAIKTAAFRLATAGPAAWPNCSK